MCDMTHSYSHTTPNVRSMCTPDKVECLSWLVYMCDMIYSYAWHVAFIYRIHYHCVTAMHVTGHIWIYVSWLIHVCDIPYSYGQHKSFIFVLWHDFFLQSCTTWLILTLCAVQISNVWHDLFICVTKSFIRVPWLIHMCDMTHSFVRHASS